MIAGLSTHEWLLEELGPYVVGGVEVRIVVAPSLVVRIPTPDERSALDAYLSDPATRDPTTGEIYALCSNELPGFGGGTVLTYPLAAPCGTQNALALLQALNEEVV